MYVCMYVCMYACMYACMHACMHACLCVCVGMYVRIYIYIYLCVSVKKYALYRLYPHDFPHGCKPIMPMPSSMFQVAGRKPKALADHLGKMGVCLKMF